MSKDTEDLIQKIASAPAEVLETTIESSKQISKLVVEQEPVKRAKAYWRLLGPGLTTGAADDDPSGIATYSQTGATYGFSYLWLSVFTFPLMSFVQEMCARIGLVTGRGLAANMRLHFPRSVILISTVSLFVANTFNIGANLGAMAKSTQLLFPSASFGGLVLLFTVLSLLAQIFLSYSTYSRYLKWLALVLLSYIVTAFVIPTMDWQAVWRGTVFPTIQFSRDHIVMICAILGTTISPYLFFWQTSQEVEEQILEGRTTLKLRQAETSDEEIRDMRIDVWSGMFLSNLVMFFIIATCAATLFSSGGSTTIETAADAAAALRPLAGDGAYLLFALGVIGTGMLAVPVLSGSVSYAVSESLGWKYGLFRKLKEAAAFYGVIIIAMLVGFGLNFVGIDPMKALIYSAIANGLVAPLILIAIVVISSNKKIMGERANHPVVTGIGWLVIVLMSLAGIATIISLFL